MQSQYVFIHDALKEFLTCGDTDVNSVEGENISGFQKQFEVQKLSVATDSL